MIQIYISNFYGVVACLTISVLTTIYFLRNELRQLVEEGATEYLSDFYNWIDLSSAGFFIFYSCLRVYYMDGLPNIMIDNDNSDWDEYKNISAILRILILVITLQMLICIFFYLRVIGEYGKLIMLIA